MPRRWTPAALLCALAAVLCVAGPLLAQNATPPADRAELQTKFAEALKAMREGKHDAAIATLDELLKLQPTSHEALVLREKAGVATLGLMLGREDVTYRRFALMILRRAEEESKDVDRQPATIAKYLALLPSEDVVTREDAIFRLSAIGSAAVPPLLDVLLSGDPLAIGVRKASALRTLRMMGTAAIPPTLAAVRHADPDVATRLVPFLTEIPDARSLPVLAGILDTPDRPDYMKKVAGDALDELVPPPPPPPPVAGQPAQPPAPPKRISGAVAAYRLALRYYYNDPILTTILPSWEWKFWSWDPKGKSLAESLVAKDVPPQHYSRTLCERLLVAGMRLPHDQPDLIELYISNNFMQYIEALAAGKAEAAKFEADRRTNESFGARYLYLSLGRALRDRNEDLAIQCIDSLRNIGDPRLPTDENTLVSALDFPNKFVRAKAAETLMRLYPAGDLAAADAVMATAASALGALTRARLLLLTADDKLLSDVRQVAEGLNMVVETRKEQVDALHRIKSMVPPISVFLIDTRLKGITAVAVVDSVRREGGLAKLPMFLFTPKEDVAKVAAESKGKVPAVCAIPVDPAEVQQFLKAAAAAAGTPAVGDITENLDILSRMLAALKALPPGTRYPVRELTPAIVRLTTGFPADVRRLALQALAGQPDPAARDAAYAVFINAKDPLEVRRDAGAALLRILPLRPAVAEDQVAAFRKATTDPDAEVAGLANRMLAVASIPQAQREAAMLGLPAPEAAAPKKPAATPTTTSAPAGAATPPKAAVTTTTGKAGAAPKPVGPKVSIPTTTAKPAGK
jgi:hypothetical protein